MKRFFALAIVFCIAITLSGCASLMEADKKKKEDSKKIPICKTDQECKMAMAKATEWVTKNCSMKIQVANDSTIQTFNAMKQYQFGCNVFKSPLADGTYQISLDVSCPYGGCLSDYWTIASFNNAVNDILPK